MYDILQLNDMLVPELLDIAEQLKIPNVKKLSKQDLVYKILDSQAIAGSKGAKSNDDGKRKRIVKANTSIGSEEALAASCGEPKPITKTPNTPAKKETPIKRARKKNETETREKEQPEAEVNTEVAEPPANV